MESIEEWRKRWIVDRKRVSNKQQLKKEVVKAQTSKRRKKG